nr:nematode resistance protein-like HSPRO2 [Ipomoea batatas]
MRLWLRLHRRLQALKKPNGSSQNPMKLYAEKDGFKRIHLVQGLQAIEMGVKRFYYSYKQLLTMVMGSLEAGDSGDSLDQLTAMLMRARRIAGAAFSIEIDCSLAGRFPLGFQGLGRSDSERNTNQNLISKIVITRISVAAKPRLGSGAATLQEIANQSGQVRFAFVTKTPGGGPVQPVFGGPVKSSSSGAATYSHGGSGFVDQHVQYKQSIADQYDVWEIVTENLKN